MRLTLTLAFCTAMLAVAASGHDASPLEEGVAQYSRDEFGRVETVTTPAGTTRYSYFEGIKEPFLREVLRADGTKEEFSLEVARTTPSFFTPAPAIDPLSQSHNRFLFTSHEWHPELKLYLTPSGRFYDPMLGRFVQQDSHLGDMLRPPSLHRYTYAHGNPTTFIDPTGHEAAIVTLASIDPKARQRLEQQAATTGYNAAWATGAAIQAGIETGHALVGLARLAMDEQAQAELVQRTAASLKENAPTILRAAEGDPIARGELLLGAVEPRIQAYERGVDEYAAADGPVARGRSAVRTTFPEGSLVGFGVAGLLRRGAAALVVAEGRAGAELVPAVRGVPAAVADAAPTIEAQVSGAGRGSTTLVDAAPTRTVGLANEVGTAGPWQSKFWKPKEVAGTKVFQRNDLIDPARVDAMGRTNLQRMDKGLSPLGPDGKPINLHHMLQTPGGPLAEVTQSFHQAHKGVLHINPSTVPSGIVRSAFDAWRANYWKRRALDFRKSSS